MVTVKGSVSIQAPPRTCFTAITHPDLWPRFNRFCRGVEIVSQEGNITTFIFYHTSGDCWRSSQFASPEEYFCFTERLPDAGTIASFQFVRSLQPASDNLTLLDEEVRIELKSNDLSDEEVVRRVQSHMSAVHQQLKEYLESHPDGNT
jgi:hypothetical protein